MTKKLSLVHPWYIENCTQSLLRKPAEALLAMLARSANSSPISNPGRPLRRRDTDSASPGCSPDPRDPPAQPAPARQTGHEIDQTDVWSRVPETSRWPNSDPAHSCFCWQCLTDSYQRRRRRTEMTQSVTADDSKLMAKLIFELRRGVTV